MSGKEERLALFQELMSAVGIWCWQYGLDGELVGTTCDDPEFLKNLWELAGHGKAALSCWKQKNKAFPVYLSDSIGLIWLAQPWMAGEVLAGMYVLGPVLSSGIGEASLNESLRTVQMPKAWRDELKNRLFKLPVTSPMTIPQYGIMLHKCVTGENIRASDIYMPTQSNIHQPEEHFAPRRRRGIYESELIMLNTIGSGMMDDETLLRIHGEVGMMSRGDPLRQAKNNVISEIALISRAAIRGGLPEETALEMADQAVLAAEDCTAPMEAWQVLPDFAYAVSSRVHQMRAAKQSRLAVSCEDYFGRNLTKAIDYNAMAKELGYSRNYLAAKYRGETGKTLAEELLRQRIEKAQVLLCIPEKPVQEIAEELHFSTSSHFSSAFRKMTGQTPTAYRAGHLENQE